jgi:EAL domain-containing protein (putative c-di-GMP-specific phosphodiesterase class I)
VPPAVFIPMIEALGLETALGDLMRRQALELAARLRKAGHPMPVSVNLTARELRDVSLPDRIIVELAGRGLPAEDLILEVTESQLIQDFAQIGAVLDRLREAGVQLSIDDFGTGFSSLSYLNRLPVDELKIDGSFVSGAARGARDEALLRAIVGLGRTLGLSVVAEGVETQEQMRLLESFGGEIFQGWYFGRPIAADDFVSRVGSAG